MSHHHQNTELLALAIEQERIRQVDEVIRDCEFQFEVDKVIAVYERQLQNVAD